jgi:hypothetical protein
METADVVKIYVQDPCEALRQFVKRFLVIEFSSAHNDSHLPDTGFVAAFSYKGDLALDGGIKAPQAAITGLWDTRRSHNNGRDRAVVLAAFTATGAAVFLRHPSDEFFNATASSAISSVPIRMKLRQRFIINKRLACLIQGALSPPTNDLQVQYEYCVKHRDDK